MNNVMLWLMIDYELKLIAYRVSVANEEVIALVILKL